MAPTLVQCPATPMTDEIEATEKWDYDDLGGSVSPFAAASRLDGCTNGTLLRCDRVHDEFTAKSVDAQSNLETTFYEMCYQKVGDDIHTFLTNLCYQCEELAAAGVHISLTDGAPGIS
jgi:hypothetical protein